jgi:hypothetical protein
MMYDWLPGFLNETHRIGLSRQGAAEAEIAQVETALGIPLPFSYREFLKVCNGGDIYGYQIFSTQDLLSVPAEFGFRSYQGAVESVGPDFGATYARKPAHLLPIVRLPQSPDLYCLETRPNGREEKPLCKFDHEVEDIDLILEPRFPDFEAFFLEVANTVSEEPESYMEDEDTWDEEEVEQAEEAASKWQTIIRQQLTDGGADMSDPWEPLWTDWRGNS